MAEGYYKMVRADFKDDKAWRHFAGAHEMAALSMFLAVGNPHFAHAGQRVQIQHDMAEKMLEAHALVPWRAAQRRTAAVPCTRHRWREGGS